MFSKQKSKAKSIGSLGNTIYSLAPTRDQKHLYVGTDHKTIKVFNILKNKLIGNPHFPNSKLANYLRRAGWPFSNGLQRRVIKRRVDDIFGQFRLDHHYLGEEIRQNNCYFEGPHWVGLHLEAVQEFRVPVFRELR